MGKWAVVLLASAASAYKNVVGGELEHCSGTGMALTGYTRQGLCVDRVDDAGSHHICINMQSNVGGNFCSVTGQPDWCSSSMTCDDGTGSYGSGSCQVQNWCVCQWAFASYLQRAGGCDKIQEIVCEATNMEAYKAYASNSNYAEAKACIESRCGLGDAKAAPAPALTTDDDAVKTASLSLFSVEAAAGLTLVLGVSGYAAAVARRGRRQGQGGAHLGKAKEVALV